jgi:hypothetical protein
MKNDLEWMWKEMVVSNYDGIFPEVLKKTRGDLIQNIAFSEQKFKPRNSRIQSKNATGTYLLHRGFQTLFLETRKFEDQFMSLNLLPTDVRLIV